MSGRDEKLGIRNQLYNEESFKKLRCTTLKISQSIPDFIYGINESLGLKLLPKLRLHLSNVTRNMFKHGF